jgi:molybdopterin-guanine dinucleotide biosynthesis protein A
MMTREAAGVVLAGGRSSRMGQDKAVQPLGGRPLLAWSLAALDATCVAVAVSAAPGGAAAALGVKLGRPILADHPDHVAGPLAGVAAGLAWARLRGFDLLFNLPCDTPLVRADHFAALFEGLSDHQAAFAVAGDAPQPLCALWRVDLRETLDGALAGGRHPSVRGFLADIGAAAVSFPDAAPFRNVNTPDDLAVLRRALEAAA